MHGIVVSFQEYFSLLRELNLESQVSSYTYIHLSLLTLSYLFFRYRSPSSHDCCLQDRIANIIDKAFSSHLCKFLRVRRPQGQHIK